MTGYPKFTFRTNIRLRIKVNPPWLGKPNEVMKQSQDISEADEFMGVVTKKIMVHKQSNLLQLSPESESSAKQRYTTTQREFDALKFHCSLPLTNRG